MKISFIAPVYNESAGIAKNVQKILSFAEKNFKRSTNRSLAVKESDFFNIKDFEIILVDDGSTDATWSVLQKLKSQQVRIDKNPQNLGPGAAFRRGFALARGDVIVTLDSDLSYPIEDTLKLLQKLNDGYAVAIASPFVGGAGYVRVPFFRVLISKMGTLFYTLVLGQSLSTYTGFFRAYKKEIIQSILPHLQADGFEGQVELIWKARRAGAKFAEMPSFQNYDPSRGSKFNVPRELGRHLSFLLFKVIPGQISYLLFKK